MDFVDVVNEPLNGHGPPDGGNGLVNYKDALGGDGSTGMGLGYMGFSNKQDSICRILN